MRVLIGLSLIASLSACAATQYPAGTFPDERAAYDAEAAAAAPSATATGAPLSALIEGSAVSAQPIDAQPQQSAANFADPVVQSNMPLQPIDASNMSVVDYALSTNNPVGQRVYERSGLSGSDRAVRNCARYGSAQTAQEAFLAAGGPQKDKHGLDPDGDGFACAWDPTAFRSARAGVAAPAEPVETGVTRADLEALGITTEEQ